MDEYCTGEEQGAIYYCAGDFLAPDEDHKQAIYFDFIEDITPEGSSDYYTIVYMKVDTTEFAGKDARIHSLRFDFMGFEAGSEFEIIAAGYFATAEDMVGYVTGREEGFHYDRGRGKDLR